MIKVPQQQIPGFYRRRAGDIVVRAISIWGDTVHVPEVQTA